MWFIARLDAFDEWEPVDRFLYPIKKTADYDCWYRGVQHKTETYRVMDADHEPGRSIFATKLPF